MEYRRLGASGLKVPALSFGAGTFGGRGPLFGAWGTTDAREARRLVDICLDAGVTMFDTADVYSDGASEEVLGEAIKGRRDRVIVSTKAGLPTGDGPNDAGSSRSRLITACEDALRRLGTDHIDLFQLHAFDAGTPVEEVLSTLDDLVRAGKVRYTGISNFSGWQAMKSLAVAERYGHPRHVAHQVHYSLVSRDYEWELMPLGLDQGLGALVWSPLGWGRLTGRVRRDRPLPAGSRLHDTADYGPPVEDAHLYRVIDALDEVAEETGRAVPHRRPRRGRGGDRQGRSADRHQLAAAAADRLLRHHRRPHRGAAPPEPRRRRLDAHARPDGETQRGERQGGALPVLPLRAPGRLRPPRTAGGRPHATPDRGLTSTSGP
jgi:aryl-alcohol dehydrogenase-like predicted oxidoreductase